MSQLHGDSYLYFFATGGCTYATIRFTVSDQALTRMTGGSSSGYAEGTGTGAQHALTYGMAINSAGTTMSCAATVLGAGQTGFVTEDP